MEFYVLNHPREVGTSRRESFPYVELVSDNWDDFGYKTLFTSYFFVNNTTKVELGGIKILHITEHRTTNPLPYRFQGLEEGIYCSLGLSMDYYRQLEKLGKEHYDDYLHSLKDIAIYKSYYEPFKNHTGITDSFFRSSEPKKAFNSAIQFFGGVRKDEVFKFRYAFRPPYSTTGQIEPIYFDFTAYNLLPNRIYILVGKNGSGKTQFLSQFANSLCGEETKENSIEAFDNMPLFSKVIAVSFSAFDDFNKPHQGKKKHVMSDDDKTINNYIYCGIQGKDKKTLSIDEMKSYAKNKLLDLKDDHIKFESWKKIMENVFEDEFRSLIVDDEPEKLFDNKLSSGQSILLYTMTNVIANIEYESILLFDEPELHLHPNAISNLMRMLYELLKEFNSYAIVSTHSPLIVQETPSKSIKKIERRQNYVQVNDLSIESFGENLTAITEEVFNVREIESNYMTILREAVIYKNKSFQQILDMFPNGLSYNAMTYLNIIEKHKNEERA